MRAKLTLKDEYTGMNSMPYIGSRFLFKLPLAKAKEDICPICNLSIRKELNDMKILVAEDDRINFLVFNFLLKEKVKKVDRAINGKEAVELTKANEYDLIFMDMNMPLMGGLRPQKSLRRCILFCRSLPRPPFQIQMKRSNFWRQDVMMSYLNLSEGRH